MSDETRDRGPTRDASVVVARDTQGKVAILSADFPQHGGEYLFLPGGRREEGESALECAQRELREEAGVSAVGWRSLGSYAITLGSTARVHLFEARDLTLGTQQLTPTEVDFELSWWPMKEATAAVAEGRFLLPAGPLALLLAERSEQARRSAGEAADQASGAAEAGAGDAAEGGEVGFGAGQQARPVPGDLDPAGAVALRLDGDQVFGHAVVVSDGLRHAGEGQRGQQHPGVVLPVPGDGEHRMP
jgi:ADP-ribose pyrophosphatase